MLMVDGQRLDSDLAQVSNSPGTQGTRLGQLHQLAPDISGIDESAAAPQPHGEVEQRLGAGRGVTCLRRVPVTRFRAPDILRPLEDPSEGKRFRAIGAGVTPVARQL